MYDHTNERAYTWPTADSTRAPALRPPTKQIFLTAAVSCLGWALDLYDLLILL
jgi:hypothetical protein